MTPVEIARTYLGSKWFHQGRSRHGLDCVGLVRVAYGLPMDWADYGRDPVDGELERRACVVFGPPVATGRSLQGAPYESLRVNDLVVMAFPKVVRHVGIVGDYQGGKFSLIHTDRSVGRVTEHILDEPWRKRIRFVHRVEASA